MKRRKDGGLKIGAGDDWLEILALAWCIQRFWQIVGMILKSARICLGMGIERWAMLKYGIPDLKVLMKQI